MTKLPKMNGSLVPTNWDEDLLLKRLPDARGHAANIRAPGGWIGRFDKDGKNWKTVAMGFRNSYDMAFNIDGELFAYDSDMEWDAGTPWYRPTRLYHIASGADFGWRTGTGKWPQWFPDALPPLYDIGPGSPVGVISGLEPSSRPSIKRQFTVSIGPTAPCPRCSSPRPVHRTPPSARNSLPARRCA